MPHSSRADKVTVVSHDHPEGIKGARATTHAIHLAFRGEGPTSIREAITAEYNYDLTRTVDDIRPSYAFDMSVKGRCPRQSRVLWNQIIMKTLCVSHLSRWRIPTLSAQLPVVSRKHYMVSLTILSRRQRCAISQKHPTCLK